MYIICTYARKWKWLIGVVNNANGDNSALLCSVEKRIYKQVLTSHFEQSNLSKLLSYILYYIYRSNVDDFV